ncbi:hypothetical protein N9R43_01020 [bacterium]|nr:hypothetical protein [bacterium]
MPSNYEPKTIISPLRYDAHLLELHRQLALIAEDQDPPNPFNTAVEIDDDLSVALNDTNDLHFCIEYFVKKITENDLKYVIIGDPNTSGYTHDALTRMMEDTGIHSEFIQGSQWIIIKLNTDDTKLVIKNRKLRVEKKQHG